MHFNLADVLRGRRKRKGVQKLLGPKKPNKTLAAAVHFGEKKWHHEKSAFLSRGRTARSAEKKGVQKLLGRKFSEKRYAPPNILGRKNRTTEKVHFYLADVLRGRQKKRACKNYWAEMFPKNAMRCRTFSGEKNGTTKKCIFLPRTQCAVGGKKVRGKNFGPAKKTKKAGMRYRARTNSRNKKRTTHPRKIL